MHTINEFTQELSALIDKYKLTNVFLWGATEDDSFHFRKGLPPEAAHGVLQSLTSTYEQKSAQLAQARAKTNDINIKTESYGVKTYK